MSSERLLEVTWDNRLIEWHDADTKSFSLLASWELSPNEHHRTLHTTFEMVPNRSISVDSPIHHAISECEGVSEVYAFRYHAGILKGELFDWVDITPWIMRSLMEWLQSPKHDNSTKGNGMTADKYEKLKALVLEQKESFFADARQQLLNGNVVTSSILQELSIALQTLIDRVESGDE